MTDGKKQEPNTHENVHYAFLAAQPNFKKPEKNAENSHFKNKYADLDAVLDAFVPALNAEGVTVSQPTIVSELGNFVRTIFLHPASGTVMTTDVPLLMGKQDMQGFKSASTYARRIGAENLSGIAPSDDDDADTNRGGADMGAALKDAWRQSVEDNIPAGATPQVRAAAYADAICDDFSGGKGEKALRNRWAKHKSVIEGMEARFPDLHGKIVDAYEVAIMEATDNHTSGAP